jgi:hypothetical protein
MSEASLYLLWSLFLNELAIALRGLQVERDFGLEGISNEIIAQLKVGQALPVTKG